MRDTLSAREGHAFAFVEYSSQAEVEGAKRLSGLRFAQLAHEEDTKLRVAQSRIACTHPAAAEDVWARIQRQRGLTAQPAEKRERGWDGGREGKRRAGEEPRRASDATRLQLAEQAPVGGEPAAAAVATAVDEFLAALQPAGEPCVAGGEGEAEAAPAEHAASAERMLTP